MLSRFDHGLIRGLCTTVLHLNLPSVDREKCLVVSLMADQPDEAVEVAVRYINWRIGHQRRAVDRMLRSALEA